MAEFSFIKPSPALPLHFPKYDGKKNPDSILNWIWDNLQLNFNTLVPSKKDENEAEKLRLYGNQCYLAKEYEKALRSYNACIIFASHPILKDDKIEKPENNNEFAFPRIDPARYGGVAIEKCSALGKGFANRSAVMLDLGEYEKCLQDIDLALEYGYPVEMHHKLKERRFRCQAEQKKTGILNQSQTVSDAENPLLSMQNAILKGFLSTKVPKPPVLKDPNPHIPALSRAVDVTYLPNKERGLIATRDIKPGEVLGVERAFAVGLQDSGYQLPSNCATCTLPCLNPIPCPSCTKIVFCSKICRSRGLSEDHWLECKILATLKVCGIKTYSYKLLKTFNFSQMKSIDNKLKSSKRSGPEKLGFDNNGNYSSSSFQSVYHLHQDWGLYTKDELIQECLKEFKVTKFLELSERYFVDASGKPMPVSKEDYLKTSKMLVYNSAKNNTNRHREKMSSFHLFPVRSLINHSCSPVMACTTFGRESFWYALQPIQAGKELTISYFDNCNFDILTKGQRKEMLSKVAGFDCKCQACEENWLTLPYLQEIKLLCKNCNDSHCNVMMHCTDSRKLDSAIDAMQRVHEKNATEETVSKEEFKQLCEASEVAFSYSKMPSRVLLNFRRSIEACAESGLM